MWIIIQSTPCQPDTCKATTGLFCTRCSVLSIFTIVPRCIPGRRTMLIAQAALPLTNGYCVHSSTLYEVQQSEHPCTWQCWQSHVVPHTDWLAPCKPDILKHTCMYLYLLIPLTWHNNLQMRCISCFAGAPRIECSGNALAEWGGLQG